MFSSPLVVVISSLYCVYCLLCLLFILLHMYCFCFVHHLHEDILRGQSSSVKEGNILFNNTLNTFYLLLYGVGHNYGNGPLV